MTQGPLPLILLAAKDHPDTKFRNHLWLILDKWLDAKSPPINSDVISKKLLEQSGTLLEPFRIDDDDKRISIFLTKLAFVKKSPASRFRIVSSDTMGNDGGLVITRGGQSFYSERYALGSNRLVNSNLRFYAPSMSPMSPLRSTFSGTPHACMRSDDNGLYIDFPVSLMQRVGWVRTNPNIELKSIFKPLLENSVVGPKSLPLTKLDVKFTANENGLSLAVTKPEALIRFSSYVVQGSSVQLKAENAFEIAVELPKTAEGVAPVTIVAGDAFAVQWMNVDGFGFPDLERSDIGAISNWAFQHSHWIKLS
jgi:hypothetical protein